MAAPDRRRWLHYDNVRRRYGMFGKLEFDDHTMFKAAVTLADFQSKWIMLKVGGSACDATCLEQMFAMRQVRSMQGKDMARIERVWLITDRAPLGTLLIRELDGMQMLRAERASPETLRDGLLGDITRMSLMIDDTLRYLRDDTRHEPVTRIDLSSLVQTVCCDFADTGYAVSYAGPALPHHWSGEVQLRCC